MAATPPRRVPFLVKAVTLVPLSGEHRLRGIHPVREALKEGLPFKSVYLQKGKSNPRIEEIIVWCKKRKIPFFFETSSSYFPAKENHQGVVAILKEGPRLYPTLEDFTQGHPGFFSHGKVLALQHISDPHNLGAVTRSAYYFGVDLIILPKKGSAPLSATVHKVSSGASLLVPFYLCNSLHLTLRELKESGFHLYATGNDEGAAPLSQKRFHFPLVLILGSEHRGLSSTVKKLCETQIHIQSQRPFDSLNVSVAAGILLHSLSDRSEDHR